MGVCVWTSGKDGDINIQINHLGYMVCSAIVSLNLPEVTYGYDIILLFNTIITWDENKNII